MNGRCEEAIEFYQVALGAKVEFLMRFRDSPVPPPEACRVDGFEDKVMHATLRIGQSTLMMMDGCGEEEPLSGFRLALALDRTEEVEKAFNALAQHGTVEVPLAETFWSPCYGIVTDQFGVSWILTLTDQSPA